MLGAHLQQGAQLFQQKFFIAFVLNKLDGHLSLQVVIHAADDMAKTTADREVNLGVSVRFNHGGRLCRRRR